MNLKPARIELDVAEIQRLFTIALDDDKEQALDFIKQVLTKRVEKALQRHWVPVFEVGYGPGQADRFGW